MLTIYLRISSIVSLSHPSCNAILYVNPMLATWDRLMPLWIDWELRHVNRSIVSFIKLRWVVSTYNFHTTSGQQELPRSILEKVLYALAGILLGPSGLPALAELETQDPDLESHLESSTDRGIPR